VTTLAAWLADRHRSQGLAIVSVGGGFITPFLLPSDADAQVALFTFDGVLIAGTMYLAHRRIWPLLNVVSYLLTTLTVFAWAAANYQPSTYLVTEAYLTLFCGMFLYILLQLRRSNAPAAQAAQAALWTAPIFYYFASVAVLGPHSIALLVFLGVLASVGAGLAPYGHSLIRVAVWLAVAVPLMAWIDAHPGTAWLVPGVVAVAGIYAVNLLAHLLGMAGEEELAEPDIALLHLNPLVLYVGAHWLLGSVYPGATPALAAVFALWNGLIAVVLRGPRRQYAWHFAAVGATLLAIAIALQFDGAARTIGWSAEGAAIVWVGLHQRRDWFRIGGLFVFVVAVLQLLVLLPLQPGLGYTVVLNWRTACGALVIALTYLLAWLHRSQEPGRGALSAAPFVIAGNVLTLLLLTTEIIAYWHIRELVAPESAGWLARELMLSITYALYATALIVVGLYRRYAPVRYLAMVVFGLTTVKVFLFDLAELEQIYRVSSIIGLGVLLLLTSYLYNRKGKSRRSG
jgi:uncharacterized membrane protein